MGVVSAGQNICFGAVEFEIGNESNVCARVFVCVNASGFLFFNTECPLGLDLL